MKKRGVLIRRAALFTATVMAVTVAVSLCGFLFGGRIVADRAARRALDDQVDYLVTRIERQAPGISYMADEAPSAIEAAVGGELDLLSASGARIWLAVNGDKRGETELIGVSGDAAFPGDAADFNGDGRTGTARIDGTRYVWRARSVTGNGLPGIAVAVPVSMTGTWLVGGLSALFGAAAGLLLGRYVIRRFMDPVVSPIEKLRDVAVGMAEGNLELRASEDEPDELGELGKAVNNLSDQLARNLYTLIVERNRLRNMLNGLSEAIVAIDAQGNITHTNPALEKFFKKQPTALHLPDARMKLIPDKSIWEDFDGVIRTSQPMTRNLEIRDMTLRLTITPIVDEIDVIVGAVGLFSDITQMERLEKTRRDYVSNVSHELRTPLTAMRALVEPLRDGLVVTESDRMRYYDIILREIMRLSRLINDQLELSRLQSGTLSIRKQVMSISELVLDVCDRYSAIAEEHGLTLKVDTDFSQCPEVYANEDRLEQMLIILLDNAIKYTEKGSVSVSANWDDVRVVITVRDTGIGIEENDLPYVFDRFYKVDKAHSGKGSGLGLSIAKELLKRMDEDIWVESKKGVGTAFSFTVHRPDAEALAAAEAEDQMP